MDAYDSNITAISIGYGAAIGSGYDKGAGNITFVNCRVTAVSDLKNISSHFNIAKKFDLTLANNPGVAIGSGGSQYWPPGGGIYNANGNISFTDCPFILAVGSSIKKHSGDIGGHSVFDYYTKPFWRAGSGIGLGGIIINFFKCILLCI